VIVVAVRFVGLCCRQDVRHKFGMRTSLRAQRYVVNFVSRNFESRGPGGQADKNYLQKQRLVGLPVEGPCVHFLQHPSEKDL
jgi:hypothetical protein